MAHVRLRSGTRPTVCATVWPSAPLSGSHPDGLGTDGAVGFEAGHHLDRDGVPEESLDVAQQLTFVHADQ